MELSLAHRAKHQRGQIYLGRVSALPRSTVQDPTTDDRFNFVDKSAVPGELAALHRVTDQIYLLCFRRLIDKLSVMRALLGVI